MRLPLLFLLLPTVAMADDAVIEAAKGQSNGNTWSFSVTLSHGDTGWDDYADGWRVVAEDGTVLGTRELLHPHVNEQPFTRSLGSVTIPDGMNEVFIEAKTNTTDWGAAQFQLTLK